MKLGPTRREKRMMGERERGGEKRGRKERKGDAGQLMVPPVHGHTLIYMFTQIFIPHKHALKKELICKI